MIFTRTFPFILCLSAYRLYVSAVRLDDASVVPIDPTLDISQIQQLMNEIYPAGSWNPREKPISDQDRRHVEDSDGGPNSQCTRGPSTYGECTPEGHDEALSIVGARPGEVYYDLGAGLGKGALVAWLHGLSARGVELSSEEFEYSCDRFRNFFQKTRQTLHGEETKDIILHKSDFLQFNFDDADIVYMDSVCWPDEMMSKLADRFEALKSGSRIITAKPLPGRDRLKLRRTAELPCTWGGAGCKFGQHIYEVVGPISNTSLAQSASSGQAERCAFA